MCKFFITHRVKILKMKYYKVTFFCIFFVLFFSCKKNETNTIKSNINVKVLNRYPGGNFKAYFSESKLIKLETTNKSIISQINRIYFFNNKIFILDKKLRSIFIFSSNGEYINKINKVGKGPGEYNILLDFTIDKKQKEIVIISNGPNKIIRYSISGHFIKEKARTEFYWNIGIDDDKYLFLYKNFEKNKLLQEYDFQNNSKKDFIDLNKTDKTFYSLGSLYQNITTSNNLYISLVYSNTIFSYENNIFKPKYLIDFGEKDFLEFSDYKLNKQQFRNMHNYIRKNNYGFGISNVRESRDYIIFKFWNNNLTIYSKKNKTANALGYFQTPDSKILFSNYFAHDGNDENILSIYEASSFKRQMNSFKKNESLYKNLPKEIKDIDKNTNEMDNPLLLIYTFK